MSILEVQQKLRATGHDPGPLDGQWGPRTAAALDRALAAGTGPQSLAWGARVSEPFRARLTALCGGLGMVPDFLMACIAFETGETFSPSVRNGAGSGATGLIQFMPATARDLGTTVDALARMSALEQLEWVERYFRPYRGRLQTLEDTYMAILWPAAIGRSNSSALWTQKDRPTTYRQNAGLDANRDGTITKGEAAAKVREKLVRGRLPGNLWSAA